MGARDDESLRSRLLAEEARIAALIEERRRAIDSAESTDESGNDQHPSDEDTADRTIELALMEQLEGQLGDVKRALERLESGDYGRCEVCGRPIPPERLEMVPDARYCVEHQRQAERGASRVDAPAQLYADSEDSHA